MIKGGVDPRQPEKHTFPKQAYGKYETSNTDIEPPKPNSL
jgi:hypothetical protein